MKKIMIVFGTRPECIKLCPIVIKLKEYANHFQTVVCVTAQHREMLDQALRIFGVEPDYDLQIMKVNQDLFHLTSRILIEMKNIIDNEKPDLLLVQGDTTTTFTAALAAYYYKIKIGHVEAGLRTHNKYSPFPEEINRTLTTVVADFHFAATVENKKNLIREGIAEDKIIVTGNTVIDALQWVVAKVRSNDQKYSDLERIDFNKKVILITGHRRENFGVEFRNICSALKIIALAHPEFELVYPVHFNPNVREPVNKILSEVPNIKLLNPLEYGTFVYLMHKSYFIITDSGGIQEEAPSLGKPVLVIRNTTERQEAVKAGCAKLVGTKTENIVKEAEKLISSADHYNRMAKVNNPYGDGRASDRIIKFLIKNMPGIND
jgi:UDP-N-acetylglucosamine 2-epimerase (non-hydrolysing)